MTEFRADQCGKPVGLSGHPCKRVPGHPGICLSGINARQSYNWPEDMPEMPRMIPRRIPWQLVVVGAVFWLLACFQIFVDVYVLSR